MRTYGRLWLEDNKWQMQCDPHVAVMAKRIFQRIPKSASGVYSFENTRNWRIETITKGYPDNIKDLT